MFIEVYLLTQVTLIPVYVVEFDLSILEASVVVTVQSLVGLSMNLPAGFLADRFNAKQLLFVCMMIEGASALFLSQTGSFWTLVLGVAVLRISSSIYHVSGLSQISKSVKRDRLSRFMGIHNAFGSIGSAIGVISLGIFLSTVGWRWVYLFWSIPILAWGFALLRSPKLEPRRFEKREAKKGKGLERLPRIFSREFIIFLISLGFRGVGISGISTFMTTYLVNGRGLSKSTASLIFGLGPVIGIFGSLSGGYLGDKMGAKKTLSVAISLCVISIFMLAVSSQVHLLTVIYILYSFFNNSAWTPTITMVTDITPVTERGAVYSVYFLTEGLIFTITPTVAATVIQSYDIWHIFPFSLIFMVTSLIVLQYLSYPKKPTIEQKK